jgi:hypothetical protein
MDDFKTIGEVTSICYMSEIKPLERELESKCGLSEHGRICYIVSLQHHLE